MKTVRVGDGFFRTVDANVDVVRVVLEEMKQRERQRGAARTEAADRERAERNARWEEKLSAWIAEDPERRARRDAHIRLRKETPSKPKPLPRWDIEEDRVTTHELSIADWCRSYNPDNFPDDFEPPEDER